jgi:MoxR-like ATPase
MRLRIGYPDAASEREILRDSDRAGELRIDPVLTTQETLGLQAQVSRVTVDDALLDYILAIVDKTRHHDALALGVSPRGAQAMYRAAQALAMMEGRAYVIPDDIKRLAVPVFSHRVVVNTRTTLTQRTLDQSDRILQEILTLVSVPL